MPILAYLRLGDNHVKLLHYLSYGIVLVSGGAYVDR